MGMFDIDDFKAINDKLWHDVWDQVLIELVTFLKSHLRDTDIIYRLHWDEFAILFDSDHLEDLAKKIHQLKVEFFDYIKEKLWLEKWVWTSWGLIKIPPFLDLKKEISYMSESKSE
jgi:diguanylate cyclase (GGDEF)-like protein